MALLVLGGTALLVAGAPLAEDLVGAGASIAAGRRAPSPGAAYAALRSAWSSEQLVPDRAPRFGPAFAVASLLAAAFGCAAVPAAMLIPLAGAGAGAMPFALLRAVSALFALAVLIEESATAIPLTLRALPVAVLALPALLFVAVPFAIEGGSTRIGPGLAAVAAGSIAPRLLAAGALAFLLAAEEIAAVPTPGAAGPVGVVLALARCLRRIALLALLAGLLPPGAPSGLADGIVPLLLAIPVLALKLALGAFALGAARPFSVAIAPERLLGGATVLAGLGAVLALVGQTLE